MVNELWEQFDRSEDFDLDEVTDTSDEADSIIDGGLVGYWSARELAEKAKVRPYIAGIILSTWSVTIIASIFKSLISGTFLLAVPSILISVPVCIVLRYYFSRR